MLNDQQLDQARNIKQIIENLNRLQDETIADNQQCQKQLQKLLQSYGLKKDTTFCPSQEKQAQGLQQIIVDNENKNENENVCKYLRLLETTQREKKKNKHVACITIFESLSIIKIHFLINLNPTQKNNIIVYIQKFNSSDSSPVMIKHQQILPPESVQSRNALISQQLQSSVICIEIVLALQNDILGFEEQQMQQINHYFQSTNAQIISKLIEIMFLTTKARFLNNV